MGIFHCCIWQKNVQRKINLIKSLNTVLYLQKRHCYGSKTCCEGCFMLILFHVLSLIWGQLYRSLDNGLTCSGNGCLEQQLGTTEEPIQPVGINSLLLHWFFILLFSLFWFRSSLFLVFGGRGRRKALHMDVIGSCESGPVCVRVLQNSRAVDESGAMGPILFNWAVSLRQGSRWHWNKSSPRLAPHVHLEHTNTHFFFPLIRAFLSMSELQYSRSSGQQCHAWAQH